MPNRDKMIKPDRHTNPDYSVINISAFVLTQLNTHYAIGYDDLMKKVKNSLGEKTNDNYPYALNLLFILGKLNYIQESDSFKLIDETK